LIIIRYSTVARLQLDQVIDIGVNYT